MPSYLSLYIFCHLFIKLKRLDNFMFLPSSLPPSLPPSLPRLHLVTDIKRVPITFVCTLCGLDLQKTFSPYCVGSVLKIMCFRAVTLPDNFYALYLDFVPIFIP